jgi:hypothetical protein
MKLKPTLILLIALGPMIVCASVFSFVMNKQKETIESQELRILFLKDYRDAYMTHFDSCHCHDDCFNWPNYINHKK